MAKKEEKLQEPVTVEVPNTVKVKSYEHGKVGLFEIDERHPGGEIFVAYAAPVEAFLTEGVKEALKQGRIVQVK